MEKLHRTNASIWFNEIYKTEHLTPQYIHITVNGNNPKSTETKNMAIKHHMNQEMKHRYKKKALLNLQLYKTHLECANFWQNSWPCIQTAVNERIKTTVCSLYDNLTINLTHYEAQKTN